MIRYEKLLQFVWQMRYYNAAELRTTAGEPVRVVHPGQWNHEQGPDFLQARVQVGDALLAGSVEIHLRSSDWNRHRHTGDPLYDNVVLHVVEKDDGTVGENRFPVLVLGDRIAPTMLQRYEQWMGSERHFACGESLSTVDALVWSSWKARLMAERLDAKAVRLATTLNGLHGDWEGLAWIAVCRSFGGKQNADLFEEMATNIDVRTLAKHRHSSTAIEAMILGGANLLDPTHGDDYAKTIFAEWTYLKSKLNLPPVHRRPRFLRMHPASFPTVRGAQLAALFLAQPMLFQSLLAAKQLSEVESLLSVAASGYWDTRYRFDAPPTKLQSKRVGDDLIQRVVINAVAPMLYLYGSKTGDEDLKEKAIAWLEALPAEDNAIVRRFTDKGVPVANAADSQALLQLQSEYCEPRRCLECGVGAWILKEDHAAYVKGR